MTDREFADGLDKLRAEIKELLKDGERNMDSFNEGSKFSMELVAHYRGQVDELRGVLRSISNLLGDQGRQTGDFYFDLVDNVLEKTKPK